MSTSLASSLVWGSGNSPTIYIDISYDASRSGANMVYTVYLTARKPSGTYGYNIKANVTLDGGNSWTGYIKNNSTTSWSSYSNNTGSKTVSNKTSGTTALRVEVWSDNAGTSRDTVWNYSLPVSAAGSSISASNGTLGVEQTITITKQNSSFTDTVTYTCGAASGTIATDSTATSISWTPPLSLAAQNTTGTSVAVTLTTTTKSGSTTIQSKTVTITETIPASVVPTASMSLSAYDSNYGGYVQGETPLTITMTGTGVQGSTITAYNVTVDGNTYSTSSTTIPSFQTAGQKTITGYVTDTRGRVSATQSQTITVVPYSPPVIGEVSAYRCDSSGAAQADGEYAVLVLKSASITAVPATGTNKNTPIYRVRYQSSSAVSATTYTWSNTGTSVSNLSTPTSGSGYPIPLSATDTLSVSFEVVDQFETTIAMRTIAVATKFIDANDTKTGLAIGRVSTKDGLQIAFDTFYESDVQHETAGAGVFAEDVQSISAPSSVIPIMYGGTGADDASTALSNLGGQPALSVENISSQYTFVRTGGTAGSAGSVTAYRYGNVVHISLMITTTASTSDGSNLFAGTLSGGPLPVIGIRLFSYVGGIVVMGDLGTTGNFIVRACGGSCPATNYNMLGMFITA